MANRFLSSGDETLNHLLAGFATLSDEGDSASQARRGAAGFAVLPLIERIWTAAAAAASGGGIYGGGDKSLSTAERRLIQKL